MPKGRRNSSKSISPGCVGGRRRGKRRPPPWGIRALSRMSPALVVVGDLNFAGICCLPAETNAILIVDANTVLPLPFSSEAFQPVPGRDRQVSEIGNPAQLVQFAPRDGPDGRRTDAARRRRSDAIKHVLSAAVPKGPYHELHYNATRYKRQGPGPPGGRSRAGGSPRRLDPSVGLPVFTSRCHASSVLEDDFNVVDDCIRFRSAHISAAIDAFDDAGFPLAGEQGFQPHRLSDLWAG